MRKTDFDIIPIRALRDNYIWMIADRSNGHVYVVDPGEAAPVMQALRQLNFTLKGILLTHHHNDHSGGIQDLLAADDSLTVIASHRSQVPGINRFVKDGDTIDVLGTTITAMEIPGHTLDHTAYYLAGQFVFSGDTLFSAGCGRVFEGTPAMMYQSLQKIVSLCTLPSTLAEEAAFNPFLRCEIETVIRATENHTSKSFASSADVFAILREWKNQIN